MVRHLIPALRADYLRQEKWMSEGTGAATLGDPANRLQSMWNVGELSHLVAREWFYWLCRALIDGMVSGAIDGWQAKQTKLLKMFPEHVHIWVCLKMGYTHAGYILGNIFGKYLRWLRTTNLNPSLGVEHGPVTYTPKLRCQFRPCWLSNGFRGMHAVSKRSHVAVNECIWICWYHGGPPWMFSKFKGNPGPRNGTPPFQDGLKKPPK